MDYSAFVQDMGNIQYDVLFDKDSWLKESGKDVVVSMVDHLKNGGYWITNTNLGGAWVGNLLAAVGVQEVTAQLGPINLTFGFSAVTIYRKQHFDKVAFGVVYEFCDSIFTICNTLDRHERVTHSDIEGFYKDHLESAPDILNAFPNLKVIAQQICNTILTELRRVAK